MWLEERIAVVRSMMGRHTLKVAPEFSPTTKNALARRVGLRCSNPDCRRLTSGPAAQPGKVLGIGVAAHITAASPGGPRYNASLTDDQRSLFENGIWLCGTCHLLVDGDKTTYPVSLLLSWREKAERTALQELQDAGCAPEPNGFIPNIEFLIVATIANVKDVHQSFRVRTALPATSHVSDLVEVARFQRGIEQYKAPTGDPPDFFSLSDVSTPTMFDWNLAELPSSLPVARITPRRIVIAIFEPDPTWPPSKAAIHTKLAVQQNPGAAEF